MEKYLFFILRYWSRVILKKYQPKVVGITGSVGKSSAKEVITLVLRAKFQVRSTYKNYNNQIGVPLAIIGVQKSPGKSVFGWLQVFLQALKIVIKKDNSYPQILVLEMGADRLGDIKYLTDLAPCDVGVLTYISHTHTEYFKTIENIANEKKVMITHLNKNGFAVMNSDNDEVKKVMFETSAHIITYGFGEEADLQASEVSIKYDENQLPVGISFFVAYQEKRVPVFLPGVIAAHAIPGVLAGLAVGITQGIDLVEGIAQLRHYQTLAGHMRLIAGIKKTLIIDDTYNSSPDAAKSALGTLGGLQTPGKKYAILSDMLEMGEVAGQVHREVGEWVAKNGVDYLITVGALSKITAAAARDNGLAENVIACFDDSVSAGRFLQERLRTGDVVLVKGSQSMRMEKIVKEIMAEPIQASELLVRQEAKWLEG